VSTTPPAPASPRTVDDADRPRLAPHVRLTFDPARERHVLLAPEAVSVLNGTGAKILDLCDGRRTVAEIVEELRGRYAGVDGAEVRRFLAHLAAKRWVEVGHGAGRG
jgi:pyrroloquinoline quinone biosynthesis protein D